MTTTPAPNGVLLVDKPRDWTSHDVVARVRRLAGTRKVGHAGTLDPMATGLLVLGLGASTRLLTYVVGLDKEYTATIRLGASTTTDDAEGDVLGHAPADQLARVSDEAIEDGIATLRGPISQVPSSVSAIKVAGKRAYDLVRQGETVELKAREVLIATFEVLGAVRGEDEAGHPFFDLDVRVECSSGTYIRALARDLGFKLGVGGHLTALRRTRIGAFHVVDASELEKLEGAPDLLAPAEVARAIFPVVNLAEGQAVDLGHGKKIELAGHPDHAGPVAAIDTEDRLIGLISIKKHLSRVLVNFPQENS